MIGKVLFCSPEVAPFAKTGGLADVAGALPGALRAIGIDCETVMPFYGDVKNSGIKTEHFAELVFTMGTGIVNASIHKQGSMYFIENDEHFFRGGLYSYANTDFPDNIERFAFFSRACVELACELDAKIMHINDWQTALVSAYIKALGIEGISTLFTIHNLAYQGLFEASFWPLLMLPGELFTPECMEYYGNINIMKAGIVLSDAVSTVSARYAQEIRTPEFGVGLDGLLKAIDHKLFGITNGIDTNEWNPEDDIHIPAGFSRKNMNGKAKCKDALKKHFKLERSSDIPVFGVVSRLVSQKGIDIIADIIPEIIGKSDIVMLGSGEKALESRLRTLAGKYAGKMGIHIGFSEKFAHLIEAGSDFFLMPSRFEPCGLNQLISLRYGTIPIVTNVGGLADTVAALGEAQKPNGIRVTFPEYGSLLGAASYAIEMYTSDKAKLKGLVNNAMMTDVSWNSPAKAYAEIYKKIRGF